MGSLRRLEGIGGAVQWLLDRLHAGACPFVATRAHEGAPVDVCSPRNGLFERARTAVCLAAVGAVVSSGDEGGHEHRLGEPTDNVAHPRSGRSGWHQIRMAPPVSCARWAIGSQDRAGSSRFAPPF
jgi:hypothetical protein